MKTMVILVISLFSGLLFAEDVSLFSRNMPMSCEYVFTVESDLRIEIPLTSLDQEVFFELQNSWTPSEWTKSKKLELKAVNSKLVGDLSFVSMSIPQKYLYRIISITFPKAKLKCLSEFGREFGEACMPGGRSETPWRTRQVKCEKLP
jgi:hypothetical protein